MRESIKLIPPQEEEERAQMPAPIQYKFREAVNKEESSSVISKDGEIEEIDRKEDFSKVLEVSPTLNKIKLNLTSPYIKPNSSILSGFTEKKFPSFKEIIGSTGFISNNYSDTFKALLLCNQFRSKVEIRQMENVGENEIYKTEAPLPDSEPILRFVAQHNYKFICKCSILNNMINCYNCKINNEDAQFYILGMHYSLESHYKYSIIVKKAFSLNFESNPDFDNAAILYYKTNDISYLDASDLEENEKEILKLKIENLKAKGMRYILFFQKKNLNEDEILEYLHEVKRPVYNKDNIFKFESGAELLAVIMLKDTVFPNLQALITDFLSIENKVWLLSNDSEDNVLSTSYLLNITNPSEVIRLDIPSDSCNSNEVWIKIRGALSKLKKIWPFEGYISSPFALQGAFSNKKKKSSTFKRYSVETDFKSQYSVLINGKTIEILSKDEDLLAHFAFISYFSRVLIGYDVSPCHKSLLMDIIKKRFPGNPIIMAIGGGYKDQLMMRKSDVFIEKNESLKDHVKSQKCILSIPKKFESYFGGDICLNSYKILRELIQVQSLSFNFKIVSIILFCYGISYLFVQPSFFYILFFGCISGSHPPYIFLLREIFILTSISLLIFFFGKGPSDSIMRKFIWIYKDGQDLGQKISKIWIIFLNNFAESLFLLIFILYGTDFTLMGSRLNYEQFRVVVYTVIFYMIYIKSIFLFKSPMLMGMITLILGIVFYFLISLIVSRAVSNKLTRDNIDLVLEIGRNNEIIWLVFFLMIVHFSKCVLSFSFIIPKLFQTKYQNILNFLQTGMKVQDVKQMVNLEKKRNGPEIFLKQLNDAIRYIFKYRKMDLMIQDSIYFFFNFNFLFNLVLDPKEITINERGYNSLTLKFKDRELEIQYLDKIKKMSLDKKRYISAVALLQNLLIICFLLIITYREDQYQYQYITLTIIANTFSLILNQFLFKIDHLNRYELVRFFFSISALVINIACLADTAKDNFCGLIILYLNVFSLILLSGFIESFLYYFFICLILFLEYLIK